MSELKSKALSAKTCFLMSWWLGNKNSILCGFEQKINKQKN